jgi:hypothetical protein
MGKIPSQAHEQDIVITRLCWNQEGKTGFAYNSVNPSSDKVDAKITPAQQRGDGIKTVRR